MFELMLQPLKKYADFSGRASRQEFWLFMVFVAVAVSIARLFDGPLGLFAPLSSLVSLVLLCPQIAVTVRRLHDVNRSGRELVVPYALLALLPVVVLMRGFIMKLIVLGYVGIVLLLFAFLVLLLAKKGGNVPNKCGKSLTAFSFAK